MRPEDRRAALERARLYLVAGAKFSLDTLSAVLRAGVDVLQLREKDAEVVHVLEAGERFRELAERAGVPFIVNDRPDVAYALGADGVHLGQEDLPPRFARDLLGPQAIIGRSTHSEEQVLAALEEHRRGWVDYIAVGPVHPTPTKPGRPAVGLGLVRFAAAHARLPWFAIGGIDPSNVRAVAQAGARRVAVVRAVGEAPDPVAAVGAVRAGLGA